MRAVFESAFDILFPALGALVGMLMIPKTVCYLWMARMLLRSERVKT